MTKNRIHSILHRNLVPYSQFSDLFGTKGREFLLGIQLCEDERFQMNTELCLLDYLDKTSASIKEQIAKKAILDEQTKRLMTIPGLDFYTAVTIRAAIGDIKRFANHKKLVSYFGLAPRVYQSASNCYTGSITKQGRSHARWVLVQAAQCLVRVAGPLRAFFQRIRARRGRNKAIVAVAVKLVKIIWHMLTFSKDYLYAPPLRTKEKLARLRVIATGNKLKSGIKKGEKSKGGRVAYLQARKIDHQKAILSEAAYKEFIRERLKKAEQIV